MRQWKDSRWGDPLDPEYDAKRKARMTRKERLALKQREEQDYEEGKTALAMGAATLNEKALLAHAAKAMFDCAHKATNNNPDEHDCIGAGLAALAKVIGTLPVSIPEYEEKLIDLWNDSHDELSKRIKAKRFPHATLHERLQREVARRFNRAVVMGGVWFRFHRKGPGSFMTARAEFRRTLPPQIDASHPQSIVIGTDWMNEENVRRFGPGTLVLKTDKENPGHLWLMKHGKGTMKVIVYVKDTTKLNGKKATYKVIEGAK